MKHTKQEIALAKKLHELGVRKEIKYGDWYLFVLSDGKTEICLNHSYDKNGRKKAYSQDINFFKKCDPSVIAIIPLWTWAGAREWLREQGWRVSDYYSAWNDEFEVTITSKFGEELFREGNTDLEAILKAMIEIAKNNNIGGKNGKRKI